MLTQPFILGMQPATSPFLFTLSTTPRSSDDGLYARGYDDMFYARESDEDLYARELANALYARALEARNRHKLHIGHIAEHVTHVAGAAEAVGNAHAALSSRYVAIVLETCLMLTASDVNCSSDDLWDRSYGYYDQLD